MSEDLKPVVIKRMIHVDYAQIYDLMMWDVLEDQGTHFEVSWSYLKKWYYEYLPFGLYTIQVWNKTN